MVSLKKFISKNYLTINSGQNEAPPFRFYNKENLGINVTLANFHCLFTFFLVPCSHYPLFLRHILLMMMSCFYIIIKISLKKEKNYFF
jgi:hypothetical protein